MVGRGRRHAPAHDRPGSPAPKIYGPDTAGAHFAFRKQAKLMCTWLRHIRPCANARPLQVPRHTRLARQVSPLPLTTFSASFACSLSCPHLTSSSSCVPTVHHPPSSRDRHPHPAPGRPLTTRSPPPTPPSPRQPQQHQQQLQQHEQQKHERVVVVVLRPLSFSPLSFVVSRLSLSLSASMSRACRLRGRSTAPARPPLDRK